MIIDETFSTANSSFLMEISLHQWQAMQDLKQRIANYEEIYETVQAAERRDGDSMEKNHIWHQVCGVKTKGN